MSQRRNLEKHRQSLGEINEIMNSMKTLAYMETHKLSRFLETQQRVVSSIETAAKELLGAYPEILPGAKNIAPIYLLIGSERGFCGDFNRALLNQLETINNGQEQTANIIAVGHKLSTLLENDPRVLLALDGAGVTEEIPLLLNQLVNALSNLEDTEGPLSLICLYHTSDDVVQKQPLMPAFMDFLPTNSGNVTALPPLLNLEPSALLVQLTEQYLFASLNELLYTSLMTENHHRVSHLEGAVKHLNEESDKLARNSNILRQEEITEEIEVILLSADNEFGPSKWDKKAT